MRDQGRTRRGQRGAAAVEAGLVTALLTPVLLGLLGLGTKLWGLQTASEYEPRLGQADVVGSYTSCADLMAAVRGTVLANVHTVSGATRVDLDDVTAEVVDFMPDRLGVTVALSVHVRPDPLFDWLPFAGPTLVEAQTRLENVHLDAQTC